MPSIPMYIVEKDLSKISDWLNQNPDIALIESVGKGKYCLYHKLAGSLPLLAKSTDDEDTEIKNPFLGWSELKSGYDEIQSGIERSSNP